MTILQDSINSDFITIINENLKPIDLKILTLENHCEDLRLAQEQALEELTKYQDNIENIIAQSQDQLRLQVNTLDVGFTKSKESLTLEI